MLTDSIFSSELKWRMYLRAKAAQWRLQANTHGLILGRLACLGQDVMKQLSPRQRVANLQKGRIDYIADSADRPEARARASVVVPHVGREGVVNCIAQEELVASWLRTRRSPLLIMDSMAELGDQLFVNRRERWSFLSAYTDISHTTAFAEAFESKGLLPLADLRREFRRFFTCIRDRFAGIPVIYLHFPSTLEPRQQFRERHIAIREALESVAGEFGGIYSLAVDDAIVTPPANVSPDMADFAYHYNHETYVRFADLVRATPAWRDALATSAEVVREGA